MPARKPKAGDRYRYVADHPFGIGDAGLLPGTVVTVREVVPADEPGAHDDTEDAVVIEWDVPSRLLVVDEDTREQSWEMGTVTRAMSIGLDGRTFTSRSAGAAAALFGGHAASPDDPDSRVVTVPAFGDLFAAEV